MMVLVLTACPAGLRGDLTKWLMEVSPGTFVGNVSARVREMLWDRTRDLCQDGRALLVHSSDGEQRMKFKTHRHDWEPVDMEGLTLVRRPLPKQRQASRDEASEPKHPRRTGWSRASAMARSRRPSWRQGA